MKAWQHLKTILRHKNLVRKGCFKVGLYRQGLFHDMSKYSPVEFLVGCKYYQGNKSPNNAERLDKGYSAAWLHHKGRNKHHLEYWIDYSPENHGLMAGMPMPTKYVVEMFIDRISASKNYQKEAYTNRHPLEYYENGKEHYMMHEETRALLEKLLHMLAEEGEDAVFSYIRTDVLKNKRKKD
ncbi:MAG: catalase [Lachnospiraceae bacterium]|nr:catalase [Lachnospiraceae bacterium]